jgi:integrase
MKRFKTDYPGVFYREVKRVGAKGTDQVYYVVYKKDGKTVEAKAGSKLRNDMTPARANAYRTQLIEGKAQTPAEKRESERAAKEAEAGRWTIARLWQEYRNSKGNLKGWKTYESLYNLHVGPNFGEKEPHEILPLDIKRVTNRLLKKRSAQLTQHVLELLRRIINYGVNNRLCRGLDYKIEMPKVDNIKTEDLTPEQLQSLLGAIEADHHPAAGPMMKLALFTGMRRGEMFRLQWDDINFEKRFISIRSPKGGKKQTIPLNDGAGDLLMNHPRTDSPYVFPGRNGGQLQTIRKPVNRIKEAAGLPVDFRPLHGLRHVYASMLASSGKVDMYQLQRLLTHKDFTMTQRYAHLRDDALKRAADVAGEIISGVQRETNVAEFPNKTRREPI